MQSHLLFPGIGHVPHLPLLDPVHVRFGNCSFDHSLARHGHGCILELAVQLPGRRSLPGRIHEHSMEVLHRLRLHQLLLGDHFLPVRARE